MKRYCLALVLLLGGCAQLSWQTSEKDFAAMRAQHRYQSALALLDKHREAVKDYTGQRAALLREAEQYQAQVLDQVDALARQKHFAKGQTLLDAAAAELPPSEDLNAFRTRFEGERDKYLHGLLAQLSRLRSPELLHEQAVYQALADAATDPESRALVERYQQDVDYFARRIGEAGTQALAQGDFAKAEQYLRTANQLSPSPQVAQQLAGTQQVLAAARQKSEAARVLEREQRYRSLRNDIQQALAERDYLSARRSLALARSLSIHTQDTDSFQKELDSAIADFVTQRVAEGNRRYANGHIEEALQIWRQANSLQPSQDLKERIEKAQKFMERYQQLQKASVPKAALSDAQ